MRLVRETFGAVASRFQRSSARCGVINISVTKTPEVGKGYRG